MIDRSKLGLILAAVAVAAVIGGLAGAQTSPPARAASPAPAASAGPAAPAAPAAKGCCEGHAGREGHDHSKCAMHAADAEHDHSKCPMHADKAKGAAPAMKDAGTKDAAAAKCPFMSKKAEEAKAGGPKAETAPGRFVCPMHPEVTSQTKDRCPKCGMFLEEKKS